MASPTQPEPPPGSPGDDVLPADRLAGSLPDAQDLPDDDALPDPLPIRPLEDPPDAVISLPGAKSITNRALVTAALAQGTTTLHGVLFADDTVAMIEALRALGIGIETREESQQATVQGCGGSLGDAPAEVNARQSGTTARFVTPLAALGAAPVVIDGDPQLRARPMADQIAALGSLGVSVVAHGEPGCLPLEVRGPISGSSVTVSGSVSSQFASGLLMAGAVNGLEVRLAESLADHEPSAPPVSAPYVDMTLGVMRAFGAQVAVLETASDAGDKAGDQADDRAAGQAADSAWRVSGGYVSPGAYEIEPDASAASYFLAAAAISDGRVRIDGLGRHSLQGDVAFADVLAQMGAHVEVGASHIEVQGSGRLRGVDVDLSRISDTAPTLAVVAAFAEGPSTITGIGFIRRKESDRIAGPVAELRRCGIDASELPDGFTVRPQGPPHGAVFETYDDHRMAMAFALVGLMVDGVSIAGPGCVSKTFPGYFGALDQLR